MKKIVSAAVTLHYEALQQLQSLVSSNCILQQRAELQNTSKLESNCELTVKPWQRVHPSPQNFGQTDVLYELTATVASSLLIQQTSNQTTGNWATFHKRNNIRNECMCCDNVRGNAVDAFEYARAFRNSLLSGLNYMKWNEIVVQNLKLVSKSLQLIRYENLRKRSKLAAVYICNWIACCLCRSMACQNDRGVQKLYHFWNSKLNYIYRVSYTIFIWINEYLKLIVIQTWDSFKTNKYIK